ncbi:MAG: ABC transporter permease [FCB group bacterium]|nr:ABC transporter permease [FCB group bacterium]
MRFRNINTVFKKEMIDTLRDRRTLVFMLLIPMAAIPLLMMGMSSLMASQISKLYEEKSAVVVTGMDNLPEDLRGMFERAPALNLKTAADFDTTLTEALKRGDYQVLVTVPEGFAAALEEKSSAVLDVFYDKAEMKSEIGFEKVEEMLAAYDGLLVEARLNELGLTPDYISPFEVNSQNVSPPEKMIGKTMGPMLPYVIIIMCFMGAMYPAIDLAAGEKERGTLETLLVSPATRGEFVVGKYLVILVTGIVAALLSLVSMAFSVSYMVGEFVRELGQMMAISFDLPTIILILLIIIPLGGIFAGVLLSVSIFARTFKEAQSYVTALNMVIILPAIISFLPGVEINYQMALIPVVNATLILKDAIAGSIAWNFVFVAVLANAVLAVLSLFFCKTWFERESIIFRQ